MAFPPKKAVNHAGMPHKSIIPKSAMYLMANEDRGSEEDQDPTDGGQGGPATMQVSPIGDTDASGQTPPELSDALHQLIQKFGPQAVREACDEVTNTDTDDTAGMQGM